MKELPIHHLFEVYEDRYCDYDDYDTSDNKEMLLLNICDQFGSQSNIFSMAAIDKTGYCDLALSLDFNDYNINVVLLSMDMFLDWENNKEVDVKIFSKDYTGDRMYTQGGPNNIDVSKYYNEPLGRDGYILFFIYEEIDDETISYSLHSVVPSQEFGKYCIEKNKHSKQYMNLPKGALKYGMLDEYSEKNLERLDTNVKMDSNINYNSSSVSNYVRNKQTKKFNLNSGSISTGTNNTPSSSDDWQIDLGAGPISEDDDGIQC